MCTNTRIKKNLFFFFKKIIYIRSRTGRNNKNNCKEIELSIYIYIHRFFCCCWNERKRRKNFGIPAMKLNGKKYLYIKSKKERKGEKKKIDSRGKINVKLQLSYEYFSFSSLVSCLHNRAQLTIS